MRPVVSVTDAPSGYEGEGFPVRRAFAGVDLADLDPFVHMDQMGEVEYAPGEPKGTPWHPHRGFETVTYMIDGTFEHSDSNGGGGVITNGDTQWMTAGSGDPAHREAAGIAGCQRRAVPRHPAVGEPPEPPTSGRRRATRTCAPATVALATSPDGGALVRIIAGDVAGHRGPGSTYTPISLVHATLAPVRRALAPVAGRLQRAGLRPRRDGAAWDPTLGQFAPASWPCMGPGNVVTVAADSVQESRTRRSTC